MAATRPAPITKRPLPPIKRRYEGPDPDGRITFRVGNDGERVASWEGGPLARLDLELALDLGLTRWVAVDRVAVGPFTCKVLGYSFATDDLIVLREENIDGRT